MHSDGSGWLPDLVGEFGRDPGGILSLTRHVDFSAGNCREEMDLRQGQQEAGYHQAVMVTILKGKIGMIVL